MSKTSLIWVRPSKTPHSQTTHDWWYTLRCVSSQMAYPFFQYISCIFSCKDSRIHDFPTSPRPHLGSSGICQLKENSAMVSELYISSKSNDETSVQDCPQVLFVNRWRDSSLIHNSLDSKNGSRWSSPYSIHIFNKFHLFPTHNSYILSSFYDYKLSYCWNFLQVKLLKNPYTEPFCWKID